MTVKTKKTATPVAPNAPGPKKTLKMSELKSMIADEVATKTAGLQAENETLKGLIQRAMNPTGPEVGVGAALHGVVRSGSNYIEVRDARPERKGGNAAKVMLCKAAAKFAFHKMGEFIPAGQLAKSWYGEQHPVTKELNISSVSTVGLMPEGFTGELVAELKPRAVFFNFEPNVMQIIGGKLKVPAVRSGATGHWVGRGKNRQQTPRVSSLGTAKLEEDAKKLEILVPIDNDVLKATLQAGPLPTSPLGGKSADEVILDNMLQVGSLMMDIAYFRGLGEQAQPRGLKAYVPSQNQLTHTDLTGGNHLGKVTSDVERIKLALKTANSQFIRPGMCVAPSAESFLSQLRDANGNREYKDDILAKKLEGFKFDVCNQFPENLGDDEDLSEIFAADFSDVYVGDGGQMEVAQSQEATYIDEDGNQINAFVDDTTLIRVLYQTCLLVVHEGNVVVMTVPWKPSLISL